MSEAKLFLQLFEPELVLQFLKKEGICKEWRREMEAERKEERKKRCFETFQLYIALKRK